jgi:hypothetical protein
MFPSVKKSIVEEKNILPIAEEFNIFFGAQKINIVDVIMEDQKTALCHGWTGDELDYLIKFYKFNITFFIYMSLAGMHSRCITFLTGVFVTVFLHPTRHRNIIKTFLRDNNIT